MRGNGLQLHWGRFWVDIRNNFSERVVRHWHSCPGRWGGHCPLEVLKKHRDVALRDVAQWAR